MPIPLRHVNTVLESLGAARLENLFGQAHARHVLLEVGESATNFPRFDSDLDDKVTIAAYTLISAGCSLAEQENRAAAVDPLERGSALLQYIHSAATASSDNSFHMLVAAMGFYAAGQYSRAFVAMRTVGGTTAAARAIAAFLRKDVERLTATLNDILLRDTPPFEDAFELDEWAITVAVARALSLAMEFVYTGQHESLANADDQLRNAAIVAYEGRQPAWWWLVRLLRLMISDLGRSSPWTVLPPYFTQDAARSLARYVRLLAFGPRPVMELWPSQLAALDLVLDQNSRGAVVNLRTSAGKTRVAELAILQTLLREPSAKVLYLAPFRSLALEVEQSLAATFSWLGYGVSHLYGGSRVNRVDTELAAESTITIATPEKARALFRLDPKLFENVKLLIVDEGHLVGGSARDVRNEVFIDHLRTFTRATNARIVLLSAVLPNAQEVAEWVADDPSAVAKSLWKPSLERFGLLRWNGTRVRMDWLGAFESFNPSFVEAKKLGFGKRRNPFPSDKNEAIAATALRLSAVGPVMIFTGRAGSVATIAEATLLGMGETPPEHPWPTHEWSVFAAVCREELEADAIEFRAARAGIVCHSNRLTPQVRMALEHLMRSSAPRIIIATTTLAQGVNVGVSTVIIATPYTGKDPVSKRDFWNICGRAGRAFVDGEGKILYAIDETKERWQIRKDEDLAKSYFDASLTDKVESGVLLVVRLLRRIARRSQVGFEQLLEMAANNDFSRLGDSAEEAEALCDLIDDELLALHADPIVNPEIDGAATWVDEVFRNSLAVLQARSGPDPGEADDVLSFLSARVESVLLRVPPGARRAIASSGLPLTTALRANSSRDTFVAIVDAYHAAGKTETALREAVKLLEDWVRDSADAVTRKMPEVSALDAIREGWLSGVGLEALRALEAKAVEITKDFYGYQLPWVVHATSQQMRSHGDDERADTLGRIALLIEIGVPTDVAAKIFLAGVRSRSAAVELARLGIDYGETVSDTSVTLHQPEFLESVRETVSESTRVWLQLILDDVAFRRSRPIPQFAAFRAREIPSDILHPRALGESVFLCTTDCRTRVSVGSTEATPFQSVANDPRIAFRKSGSHWILELRDPRLTEP